MCDYIKTLVIKNKLMSALLLMSSITFGVEFNIILFYNHFSAFNSVHLN